MIKRPLINIIPLTAVAVVGLLLGGCTTPDLKPFADSTASLHHAMTQSQSIIRSEIGNIQQAGELTHPDKVAAAKASLDKAFDARVAFMVAVVNYSDSLAAVAAAGNSGRTNMQALGKSIEQLANMAGPYGAAVAGGTEIASQVYQLISQAVAVHTLRQATTKMDPGIQRAAVLMAMDMTNVRNILIAGDGELSAALKNPYLDDLALRNRLRSIRQTEVEQIHENLDTNNYLDKLTEYSQKLGKLDDLLTQMDKWYLPLQAQQAQNHQRFAMEEDLVNHTIQGFQQWAKADADLTKALQDNRQPNISELVNTVLEIKTEIETLKNH